MKYLVTVEIDVASVELVPFEVEATSREDAIVAAKMAYSNGAIKLYNMSKSDDYDTSLHGNSQDWIVNEVE